jgi:hypothetical protein
MCSCKPVYGSWVLLVQPQPSWELSQLLASNPAAVNACTVCSAALIPLPLPLLLAVLQAARRTEKRRLSGFIRLLDYMVADCVHSMVVASMQHALQCLHGHTAAAAAAAGAGAEQTAGHEVRAVFVLIFSSTVHALQCTYMLLQPYASMLQPCSRQ